MLVALVVLVVIVAAVIWAVATYNDLVRLRNLVQEAWRQIDVELHRRHALVPTLVTAVEGHDTGDRDVFAEVTRARDAAAGGGRGPAQQAVMESALSSALSRLFAVAQTRPELRASERFADLEVELTTIEDRIGAGRRFYNANVRELDRRIEAFPSALVARLFSFRRAEYFEANDPAVRAVPSVHFQGEPPSAPSSEESGPLLDEQRDGSEPRRDA